MNTIRLLALGVLVMCGVLAGVGQGNAPDPALYRRIVFLGSSTTDGNTYPQLLRQALAEAGKPVPVCINAGIGGDTSAGVLKRLERDVLPHHPTLVLLLIGGNDASQKMTVADYTAKLQAIIARLQAAKIPVMLSTMSISGPKQAEREQLTVEYDKVVRRLAAEQGYRLAETYQRMAEARAAGQNLIENDNIHPNYAGHRVLTRAILDAMGYPEVPVPDTLKPELFPGIIREWRIQAKAENNPLDTAAVQALAPDATWKTYMLPEQETLANWWLDAERQRGFAVSLKTLVGPGKRYVGVTTLEEPAPRQAYLNTGANLLAAWLNGERVYASGKEYTGWHAGRERIPITLQAGKNTLVIESGESFFLSITQMNDW